MHQQHILSSCSQFYEDIKAKFKGFCSTAETHLNQNGYFPGVNFTASDSKDTAKLCAFGKTLTMEIELIDESCTLGLLKVSLDSVNKPELLYFVYFDRQGNVKHDIDGSWASYSIHETEFLRIFTNEIAKKLIHRNKATLANLCKASL